MPIIFACPSCGATINASETAAGRTGKCRHCRARVEVPGLAAEDFSAATAARSPSLQSVSVPGPLPPAMKYCFACAAPLDARAEICPKCGVRQQGAPLSAAGSTDPEVRRGASNKMAAGLCGIFLGGFGVHKFILGLTGPGIILLVLGFPVGILTCGVTTFIAIIIGLIEGIIYLTKSDEDFYRTYIVEKRGWF